MNLKGIKKLTKKTETLTDEDYLFAIFGVTFNIEDRENCFNTVEHFKKFHSAKTANVNQLKKYVKDLKHWKEDTSQFLIEFCGANEQVIDKVCDWIDAELEKVDSPFLQYTSSYVSLLILNGILDRVRWFEGTGYDNNPFYDFLKLVKYINSYYDIEEPTKAPNKVAWGWNQAYQKTHSKPYLFACIRNYLQQNDVEFTTLELQKIVGFKSCENGDE